jgi:hypothetical protein
MKATLGWAPSVLITSCLVITVLSAPADARHSDRRATRRDHHATQPFGYIRATDAAHGRAYRDVHAPHRRHPSTQPFAYIRAADRQRQGRSERSHGRHERRH